MRDNTLMEKRKVKGLFISLTDLSSMEISEETRLTDTEHMNGLTGKNMKGNGLTTKCVAKEH